MTQPESAAAEPHVANPSKVELEAEIARTRAEVAATLEELSGRIDPRVRVAEATQDAKVAANDVVTLVKGGGLPEEDPRRARNVRLMVGAAIVVAGVLTTIVVKAVRKHRAS